MWRLVLVAGALMLAAPAAAAVNLIANGGFETGFFTGWERFGPVSREAGRVVRPAAYDGEWGARFSPSATAAGISQRVPTIVGRAYDISFAFRHSPGTARFPQYALRVYFENENPGDEIAEFRNRTAEFFFVPWNVETIRVIADRTLSTLTFSFYDRYSTAWDLDNVSVVEVPEEDQSFGALAATAAVPEPASWALMIGGFGLVGAGLRARRTTAAQACR